MVSCIDLEMQALENLVTVCANRACSQISFNSDGSLVTKYKQRCHDPCHCGSQSVRTDEFHTAELIGCSAMVNGNCRVCGHNYTEHMRVRYFTGK